MTGMDSAMDPRLYRPPVATSAWWRRPAVIWGAVAVVVLAVVVALAVRRDALAEGATDACRAVLADHLGVEPADARMYVSDRDAARISGWVVADGRPSTEGHDYICRLDGDEVDGLFWDDVDVAP